VDGIGKEESTLRRDSPRKSSHDVQHKQQDGQEIQKSDKYYVTLPGHPFYGRCVKVLQRRTSKTYTRCVIEDPTHPDFHHHISERWLSVSPPPDCVPGFAQDPIWLPLPALDRMVQMILAMDQTRRAREDDQPFERGDRTDLDADSSGEQERTRRAALLPGVETDRRNSP
jgi:hypothetical protein